MLNEQDKVTIAREILQDQSYKTNFHLLIRVIDANEVGFIREMDHDRSKETGLNYYWVQFYVAAFRIEEKYLVPADDLAV